MTPRPAAPFSGTGLAGASTSYVSVVEQPYDEALPRPQVIRRISDGAQVLSVPDPSPDSDTSPTLIDDSIVQLSSSSPDRALDTMTTTHVATGAQTSFTFSGGAPFAHGVGWVLSCDRVEDPTGDCAVRLQTDGGVDTRVGVVTRAPQPSVAERPGEAVISSSSTGEQWAVDTANGASRTVAYPVASFVVDGRAYWPETVDGSGGYRLRLHSAALDGTDAASVEVTSPGTVPSFRRLGDGVALLYVPEGGSTQRRELRSVDLGTGDLGAVVARSVQGTRSVSDGRLLLALADTPTGRIAVAGGAGLTTVVDMPPAGLLVDALRLSRGVVASTWDAAAGEGQDVWFSSTAAGSPWSTTGPGGVVGVRRDAMSVAYSAGTLVTAQSADEYVIAWNGGARSLTSSSRGVGLGRGGVLVSRGVRSPSLMIEVQDARSAAVRKTLPNASVLALDGSWIWTLSTDGVLSGQDTVTTAVRQRATGLSCGQDISVLGDWALVRCGPAEAYAVDLRASSGSWRLPLGSSAESLVLGGGFAAWVPARGDEAARVVKVASFGPSHEVRTYGPARGLVYEPGPVVVADDSGLPTILYADSRRQPRLVDVGWAVPPPAPPADTTAPVLGGVAVTPTIGTTAGGTAQLTFGASDAVGPVTYTVAQRTRGSRGFGAWTEPPAWARLAVTTVRQAVRAGTTTCFRVRASDAAGNTSPWSQEVCSTSPLDDRSLSAKGKVKRQKDRAAMGRTVSTISTKGSSLVKRSQSVRRLAVLAKRGPREGAVKVYVGRSLIGTVRLTSSRSGYVSIRISSRTERRGDVRLVSVSKRPARIDGITLLP